jgi:hypothetical protein
MIMRKILAFLAGLARALGHDNTGQPSWHPDGEKPEE